MESNRISSHVSIKHCSFCQGTTEYYCHDCEDDLCGPCKEMHVDILDIKYHSVSIYSRKFNIDLRREMCPEHPDKIIEMYCVPCDLPICFHCRKHRNHIVQYTRTVSENQRVQFKNIIINISCKSIYNSHVLLKKLKSDLTTCHKQMDQLKTAMVSMSKRLKNSLNNEQGEISLKYKDLLVCRFLRKKNKIKRNIARIQKYEHRYEKSANRPVQFLRFIKTFHLPQMQDTPLLSQHCLLSLTQKINTGDMIKLLSEIKITESGKQRQAGNEILPTLMSSPVLQNSLSVTGVGDCFHISCVTPDRVWISDWNSVTLIDTATGNAIYKLNDYSVLESGKHTVNSDSELIYIDNHYTIRKLSADMKKPTLLIDETDPEWKPICVYCSPSSGDLLVGMRRYDTDMVKGKVMRYNDSCRPTQTIPQKNIPDNLYRSLLFITENNNGDVVVSDSDRHAVVVTSRKGIHRFSYKGLFPSGTPLSPRGICTDVMSHILLCDAITDTVHMLSQDGEFLKYLLTDQSLGKNYYNPHGLSYDFYTHCLWVGSGTWTASGPTLSVYRHINRHPVILDPK